MNNKKGGVGAKILLVLILMIASAIGGGYCYRVLDGKMAVRDAQKDIEIIRIADYDTEEANSVQDLIDSTKKDLETASTRKDVYEIMEKFNEDVSKIQTRTQKELAEARKEAEEAKNRNFFNNNSNNNNNSNSNNNYNSSGSSYDENDSEDSSGFGSNNNSTTDNYDDSSNSTVTDDYSSNSNSSSSSGSGSAITNDDGSSGKTGLLNGLLGGSDDE